MTGIAKLTSRTTLLSLIVGLVVGCFFGWLVIGWTLWPVEYVGEAYTYELNKADKAQYVAAVFDSYNLNRRVDLATQRFAGWTTEEKVSSLADLFAQYQVAGQSQEAQAIINLTATMKQAEGWDAKTVDAVLRNMVVRYSEQGSDQQAQFLTLFANELGLTGTSLTEDQTQAQATPTSVEVPGQAGISVIPLVLILIALLAVIAALAYVFYGRRRRIPRTEPEEEEEEELPSEESAWMSRAGAPLLIKKSSYRLGMDNFDESFSIEGEDGAFKGECGMGISEVVGDESPRRAVAFEVWLFDKSDIRTVTKVLMSDFAFNDEILHNKLAARGEPILVETGKSFTLETTSLSVDAKVIELEYGDGAPEDGFFNQLGISMVVNQKPSAEGSFSTTSSLDAE